MVIDTHSHLVNEKYNDLERIISDMPADNLEKVVCASASFDECKKSLKLSCENQNIYCMLGLHPDNAFEFDNEFEQFMKENLLNEKVVSVGEIGLDYHTDGYNKEVQKEILIKQMELANKFSLPINIHVRDAHDDLLEIFYSHKSLLNNGGIIHCFSGSIENANEYIKLGFMIGLGGVLTFANAKKIKEVAKNIDIKNIVVETDSPWLCPEPFRGQRNEPKFINYVVEYLAKLKNINRQELEKILIDNTYRVYKKLNKSES